VGVEILEGGLPSLATDDDGIDHPEDNWVLDRETGWARTDSFSLSGDWIIRAVGTAYIPCE
jgi:hypothetical protein